MHLPKLFYEKLINPNFAVEIFHSQNKFGIMNIKERALNAIKQNYAKFGLKAEELDKLATHIAGGLKDESTDEELNTAVEAAKFYAEMMQSVGNRKATEVQNKYKDYVPKPQEPTPTPSPSPAPSPTPTGMLTIEQVQEMINKANEANKKEREDAIKQAIAPFLEREEKTRLATMLQSHDKLKSIPKQFREKYQLDKEENLEALAAQIESEYTALKQELVSSGQFVEAPTRTSPESDADDFVKKMEDFGKRNSLDEGAQK
jgi:hypothetical protein